MKTLLNYFKSLTFVDWMYYIICGFGVVVLIMNAVYWKDFQ